MSATPPRTPVTHGHVLLTREHEGEAQVLLALTHLYLPPIGPHVVARLASRAVQYVLPGGRRRGREAPTQTIVRSLRERLGLDLSANELEPHLRLADGHVYYRAAAPGLEPAEINERLATGLPESNLVSAVSWSGARQALCLLGSQTSLHAQPAVTSEILRALDAGFTEDMLNAAANEPCEHDARALARLLMGDDAPEPAAVGADDEAAGSAT